MTEAATGAVHMEASSAQSAEIPLIPGINWAGVSQTSESDGFGISRLGIGNTSYRVNEGPDGKAFLIKKDYEAELPDDYSTITLGTASSIPMLNAIAEREAPFALSDPNRINKAADIAGELASEVKAVGARHEAQNLADKFAQAMRALGKGEGSELLQQIALMSATLQEETAAAPTVLRELARKMREARVAGVNLSNFKNGPDDSQPTGLGPIQYTPDATESEADKLVAAIERREEIRSKQGYADTH